MEESTLTPTKVDPPIFIVGCGHSGTSLLLSIIGSHNQLYTIEQETNVGFVPNAEKHMARFDQETSDRSLRRWIEKSPRHIHCIPKLLKLRPNAKILLMIRDGRDVACSLQDRYDNLDMGINRWYKDNLAAEPYWDSPGVHIVHYESLIESYQATLEDILSFLELPYDEAVFNYHTEKKYYYANTIERPPDGKGDNHDRYRNWQINQPVYDARGKWERMSDGEKSAFKQVAGEMLIRYSYAKDHNW
ncbi:MAG: sulfotransferase [Verrucomicrobiota bacterium]